MSAPSRLSRAVPVLLALIPGLFLLSQLGLPLVEDSLFWWVPRALIIAEGGPRWVAAGELPGACLPAAQLPPQWTGGLPDYGHPPTWFHYLALWIRLLGPRAWVVRLACLPVALLLGWAVIALTRALAGRDALPLALVALCSPPVLAQLVRPDTDLPLLTASLGALAALSRGRLVAFAALAALATWLKEPGVLLALPALLLAAWRHSLRHLLAASVPVLALGLWVLIHHRVTGWGTAGAEHLPEGPLAYLHNLGAVSSLAMLATGRWVIPALFLLAAALRWRADAPVAPAPAQRTTAVIVAASFAVTQLPLFAGLNFLGGRGLQDAYTHVRYLLPGMVAATLLLLSLTHRWLMMGIPLLRARPRATATGIAMLAVLASLPSARWLHPRGPEANLFGLDQARAWRTLAGAVEGHRSPGATLWVESHLFTALTRPYAGLVDSPIPDLLPFGPGTTPEDLRPGDLLIHSRYGEPLGRLGELSLEHVDSHRSGAAWVRVERVQPGRAASEPTR